MNESNLVEWIETAVGQEPIEGIVIAPEYGAEYRDPDHIRCRGQTTDVVLSWEVARPMLDYTFDDGYGSPECNAITLWTPTRVFFIAEYDGSTTLKWVPRHPTDHRPDYA